MRRILSASDRLDIARRYRAGGIVRQIAADYEVCIPTIYSVLRRYGITTKRGHAGTDIVSISVPAGLKASLMAAAQASGLSLSRYILERIAPKPEE